MTTPAHTVVLELSLEGTLPTGRAIAGDRREREFTGWLGLMGAVQALIAEGEHDHERVSAEPGDGG